MLEVFRKGQIVPRRLGLVLAIPRHGQHNIVFGCNATWDGATLRPLNNEPTNCLIRVCIRRVHSKNGSHRPMRLLTPKGVTLHYAGIGNQFGPGMTQGIGQGYYVFMSKRKAPQ